jgi:hypothetical protein
MFPGGWSRLTDVNGKWRSANWQVEPNGGCGSPAATAGRTAQRLSVALDEPGDTLDSWFFTDSLHLVEGIEYLLHFDYCVNSRQAGDETNISAWLGQSQLPAKMTARLGELSGLTRDTLRTFVASFTVDSSGAYNLGFREFARNPGRASAEIDNIELTAAPALVFHNITVQPGSAVTLQDATVAGNVVNNGILQSVTRVSKIFLPAVLANPGP